MRSPTWDKFRLLLWKNWTVQLRHPCQTAFEIVMPIFVCLMPIIIRYLVKVEIFSTVLKFNPQSISTFDVKDYSKVLAYSPNNSVLHDIVALVASEYGFETHEESNAESLENYAMTNQPFASIEFDDGYIVRDFTRKSFLFW
jgi:ATP-binding cassette, subfamily A (ABC1), member 3